ncbi:glycosyltransferase [bacterium]|nr:MAG: glycosyltransferase [bacterium]
MYLFLKADIVSPKTLRIIKKNSRATLIHFYPDNPFSLWNGNANANVLRALPLFDIFLIWSKMLIPALESAGCKKVSYMPFAYDETIFEQELSISDSDRTRYTADVSFIGTWEPERAWWLSTLRTRMPHLNLAIWGNGWEYEKQSNLANCIKGPALYPPESLKAFRCSTINLNFIRRQNMTSHNMRTFELPANKSFVLAQRTYEHTHELFKENVSIACFESIDELIEKIHFYLNNELQRRTCIDNAYEQARHYRLATVLKNFLNKDLDHYEV